MRVLPGMSPHTANEQNVIHRDALTLKSLILGLIL